MSYLKSNDMICFHKFYLKCYLKAHQYIWNTVRPFGISWTSSPTHIEGVPPPPPTLAIMWSEATLLLTVYTLKFMSSSHLVGTTMHSHYQLYVLPSGRHNNAQPLSAVCIPPIWQAQQCTTTTSCMSSHLAGTTIHIHYQLSVFLPSGRHNNAQQLPAVCLPPIWQAQQCTTTTSCLSCSHLAGTPYTSTTCCMSSSHLVGIIHSQYCLYVLLPSGRHNNTLPLLGLHPPPPIILIHNQVHAMITKQQ